MDFFVNETLLTMENFDNFDFSDHYRDVTLATVVFYVIGAVIIVLSFANITLVIWKRFLRKYWRKIQNVIPIEISDVNENASERQQYSESDSSDGSMQAAIFRLHISDYERKKNYQRRWWIPWNPGCCVFGPCHTWQGGYKLSIRVYLNGSGEGQDTHISVLIQFTNGKWRSRLPPIHLHRRTIILLDQLSNGESRHDIYWYRDVPFSSDVDSRWMKGQHGAEQLVLQSTLTKNASTYIKDGAIALKVILTPITLLTKQCYAKHGVLIWNIPNYSQLKKDEADGLSRFAESTSFFSFPYGYRMKVLACLNGTGVGWNSHLSVFLGFFKGRWDDSLPKFFAHERVFALMNQDTMDDADSLVLKQSFVPTKLKSETARSRMSSYGGSERFALHSEVETEPYLKNDQIVLKISVLPLLGKSAK